MFVPKELVKQGRLIGVVSPWPVRPYFVLLPKLIGSLTLKMFISSNAVSQSHRTVEQNVTETCFT